MVALALASSGHAAITVTTPYSNPGTDGNAFLYVAKLTASDGSFDIWSTTATPGGWSYGDLRGAGHTMFGAPLSGTDQGWGHASRWYLLEIIQATAFTLSLTSSSPDARPGFVMYAGESVNDTPGEAHTYSNNGVNMALNDGWDQNGPGGSRGLTYVTHGYNATGSSISQEAFLSPGLYTIAVGNIGDSTLATGGKTYSLNFAVPEPGTALLGLLGGASACLRRRRNA